MSLEKDGRSYGDGRVMGDLGMAFFNLPLDQQAEGLGWSDGCPVEPSLIESRGHETMIRRYAEINHWFGTVADSLQEKGSLLIYNQLTSPMPRLLPDEPMGRHDQGWPPEELETHIFGPGTPEGYAIPRLIIAFLEGSDRKDRHARFANVLHIIDETIEQCGQRYGLSEFTILLADKLIWQATQQYDQNPAKLLRQLLGKGKLEEDNCRTAYRTMYTHMQNLTPYLFGHYKNLVEADFDKYRIAQAGVDF